MQIRLALLPLLFLIPNAANAQPGPSEPVPDQPTVPGPAPEKVPEKVPEKAPEKPKSSPVTGKWTTTFYGFVEFDAALDSTQSFNDAAGNGAIAHPDSYAATHGRLWFGARNSRIGFKLGAPEVDGIKASAQLEMDFLGNQPPVSEAALIGNPTFRFRHLNLKLETGAADVLIGQSWQLFGWQGMFHPASVEIQGVPGQVYSRAPQIRLSRMLKGEDVDVELAVAAVRPPQRNSMTPDGQAGVRAMYKGWKGIHTGGSAGTAVDALAIGVSGVVRRFDVPDITKPTNDVSIAGWGVSVDALVPIVKATMDDKAGGLTFTGSFVRGEGISDLYSGLNGGVGFPATYAADVDPGMVAFDSAGVLHTMEWQSFIVGLQYWPTNQLWLAANFSEMDSDTTGDFAAATKAITQSRWADANVFYDLTPAVRLGLEYAWFSQKLADGTTPVNHRVQFSAFYIF